MRHIIRYSFGLSLCLTGAVAAQTAPARAPLPAYKVGVVSESGDIVSWFIPDGPRLIPDRVVPVGLTQSARPKLSECIV